MAAGHEESAALVAELDRLSGIEAGMATALVDLERHPGLQLLEAGTHTGLTAQRWASTRAALARLWEDFTTFRQVLDDARAVRARRTRLGDDARAELRGLLQRPVTVARAGHEPGGQGSADGVLVESITLDVLAERMHHASRTVGGMLTTYDATQQAVLAALVPLAARARAALDLARDLDPNGSRGADVAGLVAQLAELERTSLRDPLALADRPTAEVLAVTESAVTAVSARCAELVAVRDGWDDKLAELAAALADIDELRERANRAQQRAHELVAGGDPVVPIPVAPLWARLAALSDLPGWPARGTALGELRAAAVEVAGELRAVGALACGLVDRRTELRGRYQAYRSKAIRLGIAERTDVIALDDRLRAVLWTRPCDLAAATRSLVDYQRLVRDAAAGGTAGRGSRT